MFYGIWYSFVTDVEINTGSIFHKYAHIFLRLVCYGNIIVLRSFHTSGSFVSLRVALRFCNTWVILNGYWVGLTNTPPCPTNIRNLCKSLVSLWLCWRHDINTVSPALALCAVNPLVTGQKWQKKMIDYRIIYDKSCMDHIIVQDFIYRHIKYLSAVQCLQRDYISCITNNFFNTSIIFRSDPNWQRSSTIFISNFVHSIT